MKEELYLNFNDPFGRENPNVIVAYGDQIKWYKEQENFQHVTETDIDRYDYERVDGHLRMKKDDEGNNIDWNRKRHYAELDRQRGVEEANPGTISELAARLEESEHNQRDLVEIIARQEKLLEELQKTEKPKRGPRQKSE